MNRQTPFDTLFQNITPEFVRDNIQKVTDKFGLDMKISDEQIQDLLKKFKESSMKAEKMRQDALVLKEELQNLIRNSQDGNGNFSSDYFYQAIVHLEQKIHASKLTETDRGILEGLVSGAKNIVGFWVEQKS